MNNVLRTQQPLTNDQLRQIAPSVFATQPWHQMSEKYAFIPTIDVVEKMRAEGFEPVEVQQSRTRIAGKGDFTKHLVRFRQGDQPAIRSLGQVYPELLLTNSHDGASAFKLHSGLFRLVCTNGMVVADGLVNHVNVRHTGDPGDVIDVAYEVVEQFPKVLESVEKFQALRLTAPQENAFATAALQLRYDEGEAPITPAQVVTRRRTADMEPTLWNAFNSAQENLVQGGTRYRSENGRRSRTRAVSGISENTRLNKALWTLAEEMHRLAQ